MTRIDTAGFDYPRDSFRAVSVVRGEGTLSIEGITCAVRAHDHFGVPAGMRAGIKQNGSAPLVTLDSLIKTGG